MGTVGNKELGSRCQHTTQGNSWCTASMAVCKAPLGVYSKNCLLCDINSPHWLLPEEVRKEGSGLKKDKLYRGEKEARSDGVTFPFLCSMCVAKRIRT